MSSDYNPTNVTSGFAMEVSINDNFNAIKTAMDKLHSRELSVDNAMEQPLDMGGFNLLNLPVPSLPTHPLRLQDQTSTDFTVFGIESVYENRSQMALGITNDGGVTTFKLGQKLATLTAFGTDHGGWHYEVTGDTANGLDKLSLAGGLTATAVLTGTFIPAGAFGAVLDNVADDFLALQRLHTLGLSYTLEGKTALCTGTLVPKSRQSIACMGGGIRKTGAGFLFDANINGTQSFTLLPNSIFSGDGASSFFRGVASVTGFANSIHNFTLNGIQANGFDVGLELENCRDWSIQHTRIGSRIGIIYKNKSAECNLNNSFFIQEGTFIGSRGLVSEAVGTEYPEGLSCKSTLFFRFEKQLDIKDLYIADFSSCYFDGGGVTSLPSTIVVGTGIKTEGIKFKGSWFFKKGVVWGDASDVTASVFRSEMEGCHFNFMTPGTDIGIEKNAKFLKFRGNQHDADNTGTHIGYVAQTLNDNITINNITFSNYDSYVQMKATGVHNSISHIVNSDDLASPLSIEYPVNVSNVEGFAVQVEDTITSGTFVAGALIAEVDNVKLSSGIAYAVFELNNISAASNGFIKVNVYDAGTTTTNSDVTLLSNLSLVAYNVNTTDIRVTIPFKVNKATDARIRIENESGSSPTITAGLFADSLVVVQ